METATPPAGSPRDAACEEPLRRLPDASLVRLRVVDRGDDGPIAVRERAQIVAETLPDGRRVGHAAYVPVYGPRAELTLDVVESFWHLGLPELLLATLAVHAVRFRITTFLARVSASDLRMLATLGQEFAARTKRDGAYVDVELSTANAAATRWAAATG